MTIWNLLFYVDLEISSKIKLICVPTHYYWSIPFSAVNSILCKPFHMYVRYVAEVLIVHFWNYYHLRFLSPYEYQSEVNFLLDQLWIWIQLHIHICIVPFDLNLWEEERGLILAPVPFLYNLSWLWGVHSGSGSSSRSTVVLYLLTWI